MNTKTIREKKKDLILSKRQRSIIIGLLLGDGHLETQNKGRTYRLKVEHASAQGEYVQWLFEELREWIPAEKPYIKTRRNGEVNIGFTTYSHGALRFYGQQFYEGKKKRISKLFEKMIDSLGIAVWFMDDGSRKSLQHRTYNIHTLGFAKDDLGRVVTSLEKKFGLQVSLHAQKGKYWRIYIPSQSVQVFEQMIEKYILPLPSMQYKLVTKMPKK